MDQKIHFQPERKYFMKVSPVKKYSKPSYPSREEFLKEASQIKDCIPESWKNKKIITGALTVFLLGSSANHPKDNQSNKTHTIISKEKLNDDLKTESKIINEEKISSIAPLFIYGGGRGAYGCVIINPPSFLSEQEAREIIELELKKEGIIFDRKNYRINELSFRRNYGFDREYEEEDDELFDSIFPENKDTVELDGYSTAYNLGYEFVSAWGDYHALGGEYSGSTVTSFDLIKAAENLREKMKDYGKMNTVIFYDPIEEYERAESKNPSLDYLKRYTLNYNDKCNIDLQQNKNNVHQKSYELLKRQVADFIEWVKKENLLENK